MKQVLGLTDTLIGEIETLLRDEQHWKIQEQLRKEVDI
jgi:hypothetical protein